MPKREMTVGHARFAALLERTPWMKGYWNFETSNPECDLARLQKDMGVWSHGERIMAQFMAAVWLGDNRLSFDPIEAAATLDPEHRATVAEWIMQPFWP